MFSRATKTYNIATSYCKAMLSKLKMDKFEITAVAENIKKKEEEKEVVVECCYVCTLHVAWRWQKTKEQTRKPLEIF